MLVVGVANLEVLTASRQPCLPELLGCLTSLHICLEDLLAQHDAYLVDCLEGRLVIVFGARRDASASCIPMPAPHAC